MLADEYAGMALGFLGQADGHHLDGDQAQASGKLWGAAAHAVMALAVERGWPHGSRAELKRAAERLAQEHNDVQIADRFGIAEKYRIDFYHLTLTEDAWMADRPKVRDLVARVLALRDGGDGAAGAGGPVAGLGASGIMAPVWMEVEMLADEHAATALSYLDKADGHFLDGDQLQASEKLWGAAAHAIMAVAQDRGWPHTSHPSLKQAAERLATEHNDPLIAAYFLAAEYYHRDFYHLFMEGAEWVTDRPKVRDLVARVLALRNGGDGRNGQAGAGG